jgi:hypothetical protein
MTEELYVEIKEVSCKESSSKVTKVSGLNSILPTPVRALDQKVAGKKPKQDPLARKASKSKSHKNFGAGTTNAESKKPRIATEVGSIMTNRDSITPEDSQINNTSPWRPGSKIPDFGGRQKKNWLFNVDSPNKSPQRLDDTPTRVNFRKKKS